MRRVRSLLILSALLAGGHWTIQADEPPPARQTMSAPNAAGIYWHAFAAFPSLTDEEKKTLKEASPTVKAPLPDDVAAIVTRYERALHELHRAGAVLPCDWQLDMDAGPGLILPHVDKAVQLAHVALLRARQHFSADKTDAALSDVAAVLKLGHDCGSSPIVISLFAGSSIEKSAIDVLATNWFALKEEQLQQLALALQLLSSPSDLTAVIVQDQRLSCDWLEREINQEVARLNQPAAGGEIFLRLLTSLSFVGGPGPTAEEAAEEKRKADLFKSLTISDVQEAFTQMRSVYAQLRQIALRPVDQRAQALQTSPRLPATSSRMETRDDAMRYIVTSVMHFDWSNVFARDEQKHVRRKLLEQAIRIQRQGPDALQEIHGRKVEYRKTADGFELKCLLEDKPEVLTLGGTR